MKKLSQRKTPEEMAKEILKEAMIDAEDSGRAFYVSQGWEDWESVKNDYLLGVLKCRMEEALASSPSLRKSWILRLQRRAKQKEAA